MDELTPDPPVLADASLNAKYGDAVEPVRVDPLEAKMQPHSLHELSKASARLLKDFMTVTEKGLGVTRFVYCELPILWVVDVDGRIWFAVEEIIDEATLEFVMPRLRNSAVMEGKQRLGHPALIKAAPGRIGGEILFDPKLGLSGEWVISNSSGRYGLCEGRTSDHLTNAAKAFSEYGIKLHEFFLMPRGKR
ncbi:hypothetical protein JQ616_38945 [Bradyrhizobium tropiciagri]|uniref:hypothetical protein n=1 Tax=Bradyrhizobium tropiciagri TaxID=312253 RepID=UPI001BAD1617|nr:hypothetical protein [Bradyrhizobium tropiciagri]MBR0900970.1 hypothetical protein [Bradyrhizobium tropiciagri]